MNQNSDRKYIFETAPVPTAVMSLAIPTIITQLINIIYNFADTWYVGRTGNPAMVAAISVSMPVFIIMAALANVVVPWIARFDEDAWRLADALPGEDVGAPGREMALRLLGPDHNPSAIYASRSIRIQGLLELWNGYCSASPQACRSCPLASMSGASASAPRRSAPTINQSDRK